MHCIGVIIHNLFTILYKLHPPVLFLALVNVKPLKGADFVASRTVPVASLHNDAVHVAKGSRAPQPPCPYVSSRPTTSSDCKKDFKVQLCLVLACLSRLFLGKHWNPCSLFS